MPACTHCDGHVSERFARVFADEHDRVLACPGCATNANIAQTARERSASPAG